MAPMYFISIPPGGTPVSIFTFVFSAWFTISGSILVCTFTRVYRISNLSTGNRFDKKKMNNIDISQIYGCGLLLVKAASPGLSLSGLALGLAAHLLFIE